MQWLNVLLLLRIILSGVCVSVRLHSLFNADQLPYLVMNNNVILLNTCFIQSKHYNKAIIDISRNITVSLFYFGRIHRAVILKWFSVGDLREIAFQLNIRFTVISSACETLWGTTVQIHRNVQHKSVIVAEFQGSVKSQLMSHIRCHVSAKGLLCRLWNNMHTNIRA